MRGTCKETSVHELNRSKRAFRITDHMHRIWGLIHADLCLVALLLEGEHTRTIDYDDCGFGWYLARPQVSPERPEVSW